jgi:hypothetical protein
MVALIDNVLKPLHKMFLALARGGDRRQSGALNRDFFALWKDVNPEIP